MSPPRCASPPNDHLDHYAPLKPNETSLPLDFWQNAKQIDLAPAAPMKGEAMFNQTDNSRLTLALWLTGMAGMGAGLAAGISALTIWGAFLTIIAGLLKPVLVIAAALFLILHTTLALLSLGQPAAAWQLVATTVERIALLFVIGLPLTMITGYGLGIAGRIEADI